MQIQHDNYKFSLKSSDSIQATVFCTQLTYQFICTSRLTYKLFNAFSNNSITTSMFILINIRVSLSTSMNFSHMDKETHKRVIITVILRLHFMY